ncbi:MAG: tyrosine-type recombinase/integrase [Candidatus Omnitrophica bacterium]|nr:tyrosine-type recombinase/integrase [Candidatus Omnitrophota bacterium]
MGSVRKINDEFYIEFYARGLLYQQKAGPDEEKAYTLLKQVQNKIDQGEMGIIVRDVDYDIFFQTFLEYAAEQYSPKSYRRYRNLVEHFQQFCNQNISIKKLSNITPKVIEQYRQSLQRSAKRIKPRMFNFTFLLLRDVLDYAIKLGYLNDNPVIHVTLLQILYYGTVQPLTEEEQDCLIQQAQSPYREMLIILLKTGMTFNEMKNLNWEDIDFKKNIIEIKNLRGNKRKIPFDHNFQNRLSQRGNADHLSTGRIFSQEYLDLFPLEIKRLFHECNLREYQTPAVFRHSFARMVLNRGGSVLGLVKLLGLDDAAKAMRYAYLMISDK